MLFGLIVNSSFFLLLIQLTGRTNINLLEDISGDDVVKTQHLHVGLEDLAFTHASINHEVEEFAVIGTAILRHCKVQVLVFASRVGVFGDVVFLHRVVVVRPHQ